MTKSIFKYFRDPDNFSFKVNDIAKCDICEKEGIWFSAGGFSGENEIECICDSCLAGGALEELEISSNDAYGGTEEESSIIMHKTPSLPSWQDLAWPCINGEYCVFERIASKSDFIDSSDFRDSLSDDDIENSDVEGVWESMPDKKVNNHIEGNFNTSVYLFTCAGKKYCVWDAS